MIALKNSKLLTLLSLYMAQSIPMSFFSTVVPVIMRQQNYSLESIGLIQLIKLPWIIKFLWAPMVDRKAGSTQGYRRWIFWSEGLYALCVASVAFFSLDQQFNLIIVFILISITASATQDIATDAWAILTLKKEERSLGNSMQSMGSFFGAMVGSGALLVIYHYLGWTWLLLCLSGVVLLALIPLWFYPQEAVARKRPRSKSVSLRDIVSFFSQTGIMGHLLLIAVFHSGLIGIMAMVKPLMIDMGFSVRSIGLIPGLFATGFGALAAMAAGLLMRRISRSTSAVVFACANIIPPVFFFLMFPLTHLPWVILAGTALLWGAYAMGMVFIYTIAMDRVRPCREGTDFTLQVVVTQLSSLILAALSGKIAGTFSYTALFLLSILLALITLAIALLRLNKARPIQISELKPETRHV
jgi:predicted MFS family arabinose efflux permease